LIEQGKEEAECLTQEKVQEEQQKKAAKEAARKAEEECCIAKEQLLRGQEKVKKVQREMDNMKKQQLLTALGQNTETMTQKKSHKLIPPNCKRSMPTSSTRRKKPSAKPKRKPSVWTTWSAPFGSRSCL
jgi:hypothetical protein